MTEAEARLWVQQRYAGDFQKIETFLDMVIAENDRQNLIAPSTVDTIWTRHAVDSLQLAPYGAVDGNWIDIGTGGGFPGLLIAIVRPAPIILVEPRRKRAAFLVEATDALQLPNVTVIQARAKTVNEHATTVSARAVTDLDALMTIGTSWATTKTRWILPRGRLSDNDMRSLSTRLPGMFHVEHSITASDSRIVVATGVPR